MQIFIDSIIGWIEPKSLVQDLYFACVGEQEIRLQYIIINSIVVPAQYIVVYPSPQPLQKFHHLILL